MERNGRSILDIGPWPIGEPMLSGAERRIAISDETTVPKITGSAQ